MTEIGSIANVYVYRNSLVPASDTSGISLTATDAALPATLGATLAHGTFLNAATAQYPAVVLGAETASLLGINDLAHPTQVWIGGHWFTVVGILNPVELVSQMDSMAFIGFPIAEQYFGFDGHPTGLYLRSVPSQVNAVAAVLPATVDPANPSVVAVSYPSDILKAEVAAKGAYNGLLLGLGAVALLVGGVGIANVMVISVLERRSEIGLRRALGATRRHVAEQFLAEAVLLSVLGGLAGTIIGAVATAHLRGEPALVGADPRRRPLRRPGRRPRHRRHGRTVPVDAGRPPLADRSAAHWRLSRSGRPGRPGRPGQPDGPDGPDGPGPTLTRPPQTPPAPFSRLIGVPRLIHGAGIPVINRKTGINRNNRTRPSGWCGGGGWCEGGVWCDGWGSGPARRSHGNGGFDGQTAAQRLYAARPTPGW